eukprot:1863559-Ditylum_brightwellii.AAC.1
MDTNIIYANCSMLEACEALDGALEALLPPLGLRGMNSLQKMKKKGFHTHGCLCWLCQEPNFRDTRSYKANASCWHADNAAVKAALFFHCCKESFGGALACCCAGKKKNVAHYDNFSCVFFCLDGRRGGSA